MEKEGGDNNTFPTFAFLLHKPGSNGFLNRCQGPFPSWLSCSIADKSQHISPKPDPSFETT